MSKKWKVEDDADGNKGVKFSGGPCFIVRKEIEPDKYIYFLTVGVLEYDQCNAGNADQKKGVAEIACLFGKGSSPGVKLEIVELNSGGTLPPQKCLEEEGPVAAGADASRLGEAAASGPQGGQGGGGDGGGGGGGQPGQPGQPGPRPPAPPPAPAPPPEDPPGVQTEPPGVQTGP